MKIKYLLKDTIVLITVLFLVLTTTMSIGGKNTESLIFSNHDRVNWLDDSRIINKCLSRNFQNPPNIPEIPEGPTEGELGVEYTFCSSTTDPEGDNLFYIWDWDDGTYSDWYGPYSSGEIACADHAWSDIGTYCIRVKAKDIYNDESNWSDPICIDIILA